MAELDRLDREFGLGAMPTSVPTSTSTAERPPRRRGLGRTLPGAGHRARARGVVAWSPHSSMDAVRRITGLGPDLTDGGEYAFLTTRPGSDEPVGYSPCRPIEIEVNPEGAPSYWSSLVDTAIEHVSEATGLEFERVGTTARRDFDVPASIYEVAPPVLVAWATEDEVPELAGDIAGIGGSQKMGFESGTHYATGQVVLDAEAFDAMRNDPAAAQALVDHEFGHLVGLDHVDDHDELMYPENVGQRSFGPGDLEGLSILGKVAC